MKRWVTLVLVAVLSWLNAGTLQEEAVEGAIPPANSQRIKVIPVSDDGKYMVDQVQAEFIIETLDRVEAEGYDRVILKIDTFGGVVFSAREITERLLRLKLPTTAYVETKAISAGAFIAWACDEIIMEKTTTMGDAQMIMQTVEGIEEAPEKAVTVFRSDWKKSSDLKGRSFAIAQGFFDAKVEVLQVGDESDWAFMLRDDYDRLEEEERKPIVKIISKKDQLLTLYAQEAAALGIVRVVDSFEDYLATLGVSLDNIDVEAMTLNQQILRFLGANKWLFLLLTLVGLNGLYMELKAPGFGIPGLTAVVCFTIVFGSRFFLGTADGTEMALFAIGVLLCLVEIFVLPGFGVAGILGLIFVFGSLVLASFPDFGGLPKFDLQWQWLRNLSLLMLLSFVLSLVSLVFVFPLFLKMPITRRYTLPTELSAEEGYVIKTADADDLIGMSGIAKGDLRPSGKVLLSDGRFLDVVSDGSFVEDGSHVEIFKLDGNRIIVKPQASGTQGVTLT